MVSDNGGERFAVSIAWQWQFWLPVSSLESHHDILFVASDDLPSLNQAFWSKAQLKDLFLVSCTFVF
jgi:hypothetical protein